MRIKMNLDKEWNDKQEALKKARKDKARKDATAIGIRAVMHLNLLNKLGEINEKDAEDKWNKMNHKKKSNTLYLFDLYSNERSQYL